MEYGAASLLDLPPDILDKIMLEAMSSAMTVARANKHTAAAGRAIIARERRVFEQYDKHIELSCARTLASKNRRSSGSSSAPLPPMMAPMAPTRRSMRCEGARSASLTGGTKWLVAASTTWWT